jgi:translation initiation factor 2B subunit (eIF-2B alpha/beta/delta family)
MEPRPVVTCFLRQDGEVLLLRRSAGVGSYAGKWGAVAGHGPTDEEDPTRPTGDPAAAAVREIAEETGIANPTLVRAGETHEVTDEDLGITWLVHPFLFDVDTREVTTNEETAATAWVHPPAILRRDTVPGLWTSYDRVRPRVDTLREDRTHGSAWLSVRALELLRDEAALAAAGCGAGTAERSGEDWVALADLARTLRTVRASMAVLANRVNRVMHRASETRTAAAVETAAVTAIERAVAADREAAARAADRVGETVGTLSRSGTVTAAIHRAKPERVLIPESRPGREGVGVAEALADATDVTLTSDAAFPWLVTEGEVATLLVGADRILPGGAVLNKVGTRAALMAAPETCERLVVAAREKIAADDAIDGEERDPGELYSGDAAVAVANPTFDLTPAAAVDAVVTERGALSSSAVAEVAAEHATLAEW